MRDLFIEIWESIRRNKVRTCLTGLAVAWGIFMLIVLLGAGNGLLNAFMGDSDDFATNTMFPGVTSKPYDGLKQGRRIRMTEQDMEMLRQPAFADHVDKVSTQATQSGYTMTYGRRYFRNIVLTGCMPDVEKSERIKMHAGRFINERDMKSRRKVAVITHLHAKNFLSGSTDYDRLLGKRIKVGNLSFVIVGIRHGAENEDDRAVYIPYSTYKHLFSLGNRIDELNISFHDLETEAEAQAFEDEIRASLNAAHRVAPDDKRAFWIWNRFTQSIQMEKGRSLLITVKERTHEFGIRKALGARPGNILKLIVTESILITAFFGYIGMLLGMIACKVLDLTVGQSKVELFGESFKMLENPTVGLSTAIGATVVLIIAGTVAGIFPAMKAAKVKPIEALRAE